VSQFEIFGSAVEENPHPAGNLGRRMATSSKLLGRLMLAMSKRHSNEPDSRFALLPEDFKLRHYRLISFD
jgi:hypothetical protein